MQEPMTSALMLLAWVWLMVKEYKDDKEWWNKHYGERDSNG